MPPFRDITNQKFFCLIAIRFEYRLGTKSYWLFKCDCGKEKIIRSDCVIDGNTKACGCLNGEDLNGMRFTKEYRAWTHAKDRCTNQNNPKYPDYGGRGIKVCKKWFNSFNAFLADMGRAPDSSYSLERINNNKGYYPSNCKWDTVSNQNKNRRRKA